MRLVRGRDEIVSALLRYEDPRRDKRGSSDSSEGFHNTRKTRRKLRTQGRSGELQHDMEVGCKKEIPEDAAVIDDWLKPGPVSSHNTTSFLP